MSLSILRSFGGLPSRLPGAVPRATTSVGLLQAAFLPRSGHTSPFRNFAGAASAVKALKVAQAPGHAVGGEFVDRLKRWKPVTPSLRHTILVDKSHLWKGRPIKQLTKGLRKSGGRGHGGKISVRHIGGGFKRLYRFVDFKRNIFDRPAVVQRFE